MNKIQGTLIASQLDASAVRNSELVTHVEAIAVHIKNGQSNKRLLDFIVVDQNI